MPAAQAPRRRPGPPLFPLARASPVAQGPVGKIQNRGSPGPLRLLFLVVRLRLFFFSFSSRLLGRGGGAAPRPGEWPRLTIARCGASVGFFLRLCAGERTGGRRGWIFARRENRQSFVGDYKPRGRRESGNEAFSFLFCFFFLLFSSPNNPPDAFSRDEGQRGSRCSAEPSKPQGSKKRLILSLVLDGRRRIWAPCSTAGGVRCQMGPRTWRGWARQRPFSSQAGGCARPRSNRALARFFPDAPSLCEASFSPGIRDASACDCLGSTAQVARLPGLRRNSSAMFGMKFVLLPRPGQEARNLGAVNCLAPAL